MRLRRRLLQNCRLYLVLDKAAAGKKDLVKIAACAISGGVDILELRWKDTCQKGLLDTGKRLKSLTAKSRVLFIIDDDPWLASLFDSDGVHLGQGDISVEKARALLGRDKLIGYSTHNVRQAGKALLKDVDYISIGPLFKTPIKAYYKPTGVNILSKVNEERLGLPVFAIGGINLKNIKRVIRGGAKRAAVVRAIVAARDPAKAARLLKENINSHDPIGIC